MARPSQLYLQAYNSLQSLGWFLALLRLAACLAPPVSVHPAYALAGDLICFLQTCAVLETVHAAVGLVPTSPFLAFLQWGGRTHFVLALLRQIPEVQGSPSVFITFMAWSISEELGTGRWLGTGNMLDDNVSAMVAAAISQSPLQEFMLLHRRLGHMSFRTLGHPIFSLCVDYLKSLSSMAHLPQVHCFYRVVSNRGRTRRNVDYLPSFSIRDGEGPLLRLLCKLLHELPFLSRGWAAVLSAFVAEAIPACVQAAQVQAGKGGQEETGMNFFWFNSASIFLFRETSRLLGVLAADAEWRLG